jgi:hypothetical protein
MHPLPGASIGGAVYILLALVYCVELFAQRNWLVATLVFVASAIIAAVLWRWLGRQGHAAPRRLRLCSDGAIQIFSHSGCMARARIQSRSLRLGRHWLLVVVSEDGDFHRLLLGPGNLQPAEQAALGRWLRRPPADPFRLR